MHSLMQVLAIAPSVLTLAQGQGVIISAQGTKGSPASLPFQVVTTKSDANVINANEISTNVVNECGRTLFGGNIDIGENTETQLANKTVTSVTKGGNVAVTINQVNADGAGPYTCDLDLQSNADGVSGQTALKVAEKNSSGGQITLSVTMPNDLACIGASTGNVCTIRCVNSAASGPFGGCFAVQQTDETPSANTADNIATAQTLDGVLAQIAQNQIDLPAAVKANAEASLDQQGVLAVDELLQIDSTASATAGAAGVAQTSSANSGASVKGGEGSKGGANAQSANSGRKGARAFTA